MPEPVAAQAGTARPSLVKTLAVAHPQNQHPHSTQPLTTRSQSVEAVRAVPAQRPAQTAQIQLSTRSPQLVAVEEPTKVAQPDQVVRVVAHQTRQPMALGQQIKATQEAITRLRLLELVEAVPELSAARTRRQAQRAQLAALASTRLLQVPPFVALVVAVAAVTAQAQPEQRLVVVAQEAPDQQPQAQQAPQTPAAAAVEVAQEHRPHQLPAVVLAGRASSF